MPGTFKRIRAKMDIRTRPATRASLLILRVTVYDNVMASTYPLGPASRKHARQGRFSNTADTFRALLRGKMGTQSMRGR